jgi:hypothetical protein
VRRTTPRIPATEPNAAPTVKARASVTFHGKEGAGGSSPPEGFHRSRAGSRAFGRCAVACLRCPRRAHRIGRAPVAGVHRSQHPGRATRYRVGHGRPPKRYWNSTANRTPTTVPTPKPTRRAVRTAASLLIRRPSLRRLPGCHRASAACRSRYRRGRGCRRGRQRRPRRDAPHPSRYRGQRRGICAVFTVTYGQRASAVEAGRAMRSRPRIRHRSPSGASRYRRATPSHAARAWCGAWGQRGSERKRQDSIHPGAPSLRQYQPRQRPERQIPRHQISLQGVPNQTRPVAVGAFLLADPTSIRGVEEWSFTMRQLRPRSRFPPHATL